MPHLILSRDIYLYNALTIILEQDIAKQTCIVDIESYDSIRSILGHLKQTEGMEMYRLIFIGGRGISSQVMKPLVTLYRKSPFIEYRRQLLYGRTYPPEFAFAYIAKCLGLTMMTHREVQTLKVMMSHIDIRAAGDEIGLSTKTIYTYSSRVGMKLNLKTIHQVRQFLFTEFVNDEKIINPVERHESKPA